MARRLFPDLEWMTIGGEGHTAVVCADEQLIWDPTYFALGVSAEAALKQVFGDDFGDTDVEYYLEEYSFSPFTVELIHLLDVLDAKPEDERLAWVQGLPEVMWGSNAEAANTGSTRTVGSPTTCRSHGMQ